MAEAYKASILLEGISPEDCYKKAVGTAGKVFEDFKLWKERPTARLFGYQHKQDPFSTINFFLKAGENGVEIEARFNTKNMATGELDSLFRTFENEMKKE